MSRFCAAILALPLLLGTCPTWSSEPKSADEPSWEEVQASVLATLAAQRDYRSGDLISQDELALVFKALDAQGWSPSNQRELLGRALPASAPLVKELCSAAGRKFMRQVHRFPSGYDRLDRLSRLADGPRIVRRLVAGPDGYKLLEYLSTAAGGEELGKMLGRTAEGKDFNRPTGRIYTQTDLLAELKDSFVQDALVPPLED